MYVDCIYRILQSVHLLHNEPDVGWGERDSSSQLLMLQYLGCDPSVADKDL
jgi:hypothetical protein